MMLCVFHTVGMNKLLYIYDHYYLSDLCSTIFLSHSYLFPNLTHILQFCQNLRSMCLPPVLSCRLHGHCVFPLHEGQFPIWGFLSIDSYCILSHVVPYIMFLCSNYLLVPLIYFDSMYTMGINHTNSQI